MVSESFELEGFIPYQSKMCYYISPKSLLCYEYVVSGSSVTIHYKTEGGEAFTNHYGSRAFGCADYDKLMSCLRVAISSCLECLLSANGLRLELCHIYRFEDGSFKFMYLPFDGLTNEPVEQVLLLLMDQIEKYVNLDDEYTLGRIHQMRIALESETIKMNRTFDNMLSKTLS